MSSEQIDLDAVEARASAATPGWWQEIEDLTGTFTVETSGATDITGSGLPRTDAEFIAHAREDVPALVAEVRRLRAQVERVEALADDGWWSDNHRCDVIKQADLCAALDGP